MNKKTFALLLATVFLASFTSCDKDDDKKDNQKQEEQQQEEVSWEDNRELPNVTIAGIEMVYVQGGSFMMGATEEQLPYASSLFETPAHKVNLSGFYISKYEVTQSQWEAIMHNNPSYFVGANKPVEKVSYNDVQEFVAALNAQTNKHFRLPTEAEWEYAARGGKKTHHYIYSGSNNPDEVGHYGWFFSDMSEPQTTFDVGTKAPNELGLYDMSGNVQEWCLDGFSATENYYESPNQDNPRGFTNTELFVIRGGNWAAGSEKLRVSDRNNSTATWKESVCGFRLVMEVE